MKAGKTWVGIQPIQTGQIPSLDPPEGFPKPGSLMDAVLRYLQRKPLKHILHLKMMNYYPDRIEAVYVRSGQAEGILLLFPTTTLRYDHHNYARFEYTVMPVADSLQILGKLLDRIPRKNVVLKLIREENEPDAAAQLAE